MDKLELITGRLEQDVKEKGETLIQISLQYPVFADKSRHDTNLNRCFSRLAKNIADGLSFGMLGEARAALDLMPETLPYQINGTFTTTYNVPGVLSFFTDVFLYAGGMRGITYRYANSFLTAAARPLFITALFPAGTDICGTVSAFVAERQGVSISAILSAFSPENFYLTDSGLAVFYEPGAIGPVAGGISVFTMPFQDRGPFDPEGCL